MINIALFQPHPFLSIMSGSQVGGNAATGASWLPPNTTTSLSEAINPSHCSSQRLFFFCLLHCAADVMRKQEKGETSLLSYLCYKTTSVPLLALWWRLPLPSIAVCLCQLWMCWRRKRGERRGVEGGVGEGGETQWGSGGRLDGGRASHMGRKRKTAAAKKPRERERAGKDFQDRKWVSWRSGDWMSFTSPARSRSIHLSLHPSIHPSQAESIMSLSVAQHGRVWRLYWYFTQQGSISAQTIQACGGRTEQ